MTNRSSYSVFRNFHTKWVIFCISKITFSSHIFISSEHCQPLANIPWNAGWLKTGSLIYMATINLVSMEFPTGSLPGNSYWLYRWIGIHPHTFAAKNQRLDNFEQFLKKNKTFVLGFVRDEKPTHLCGDSFNRPLKGSLWNNQDNLRKVRGSMNSW